MTRSSRLLVLTAVLAAAPVAVHGQGAGWEESGEASWYGGRFTGRRTSSGERFDGRSLTAAHSTLPLGSQVRVTVQDTGATTVVRINDRMPRHGVRVIDLSPTAAARLGITHRGTAWVSLTGVRPGEVDEVAEAPDDLGDAEPAIPRRRGPRHMRRAAR